VTVQPDAERLRRLLDLEEIRALFLAYGRYLDTRDWVPYSKLFTETAEFAAGIGTARGPQEIQALFERGLRDVPLGHFHVFGNPVVDVAGDRATAHSFWLYVCPDDSGRPKLLQCGHYDDVLVRAGGRWMFQRREVTRAMGFPPYKAPPGAE
jgi:hypothetical protein